MRLCIILLALIGCTAAAASREAEPRPVLGPQPTLDEVLEALHARGERLNDFRADVRLTETDAAVGLSTMRHGRVWYQKKPDGDARIRVMFDRREDRGVLVEERVEYLLDRGWLVDRDYRRRVEVNRQVLRPGERIDLLRLGEGPFPLPIGQEPEEVRRQFEIEMLEPAADGPEGTTHLRLTPRPGSELERRFAAIDVWVDHESHMPVRIETVDANLTMIRTTDLADIGVNTGLAEEQFRLPPIDERQWDRHDEPFVD